MSNNYNRRYSNYNRVTKIKVKELDLEVVKPERAGVVLYCTYKKQTYFYFGLHFGTHDLTDFGGGVKYSKYNEDVIDGALRELDEEILGIIDPQINKKQVLEFPVLYDNKNLILFIRINLENPDDLPKAYNKRYQSKKSFESKDEISSEPEICGITLLTWEQLQISLSKEDVLYSRVKRFLNNAGDFSYLL